VAIRDRRLQEVENSKKTARMHTVDRRIGNRLRSEPLFSRRGSKLGHEWPMELSYDLCSKQYSRAHGDLYGSVYVSRTSKKQVCATQNGQYNVSSVCGASRWSIRTPKLDSSCNMVSGIETQYRPSSGVSARRVQYSGRSSIQNVGRLQLYAESERVSVVVDSVRSVHNRPICGLFKPSSGKVQQPVQRSRDTGRGLFQSDGLGRKSQLLPATISFDKPFVRCNSKPKSLSYHNSTLVACTDMVSAIKEDGSVSANISTKQFSGVQKDIQVRETRTVEESSLENVSLEGAWRDRLIKKDGWSEKSASCVSFGYAKSTVNTYNVYIRRYQVFCKTNHVDFPCEFPSILADFLTEVASRSLKPKGVLNMAVCSLKAYFKALDLSVNVFALEIDLLVIGLIKSGTSVPAARTHAMPVDSFVSLFNSWLSNDRLSLKDLRAKSIALLSLSVMLRPSDIAPRSVLYDPTTKKIQNVLFTTEQIKFLEDGSMKVVLFGIKNDTSRTGFEVMVPAHSDINLCPVKCLKMYIDRTHVFRDKRLKPVFLSLVRPYAAVQADAIAKILRSVISDAGLDVTEFSAKYFRPTGATVLIEAGHDPELVRKLGRWKCSTVFYDHYVHRKTPLSVLESVLPPV
jgi:hypothetical protein